MSKKNIEVNQNSALVFIGIVVIVIIGFCALAWPKNSSTSQVQGTSTDNITISDNQQIIEVTVRGGYSPRSMTAKAGIPTILRMKSDGAYGCERAFGIRSLGISKTLPSSGNTDIDLGSQVAGTKLKGSCSMGMYSFVINFN